MEIDTIKNYLVQLEEFDKIIDEIYIMSESLNETYPNYKNWFYEKQVKGCYNESRNIIFIKNDKNEIVGFASLKKEIDEKKLCTLYVKSDYRKMGNCKYLLEEAFKYLGTSKPLVTFSKDNYHLFQRIIEKYNWKLTEKLKNKYQLDKTEYCFNGYLDKKI